MLEGGGNAALLIPRGHDNREQRERSSRIDFSKSGHFSISNEEVGGEGQVGVDKKMKSAEYFVITMPLAGKVRPAAVICVEWIHSVVHGKQEPYCETTQSRQ